MSSESHNTKRGGMKQELHDFKNEFSTQLSDLSHSLNEKSDSLYKLLGESEEKIKANINDIVTESLMSVKDSIIETLKAEKLKLKSRVDSLEDKIIELGISRNKLDQYIRRNNNEIQGIPATVSDDHLEHKMLNICKSMNLPVENSDIEGCHRIGKSDPKTTIVRFVNRKFCNLILDKKHELKKIDNAKLCFQNNVKLFVSENLSPFNERLAWKCKELRQASKIHSAFSSKGIVKIRHTMNERPISIEHDRDLTWLYPDFIFKEK